MAIAFQRMYERMRCSMCAVARVRRFERGGDGVQVRRVGRIRHLRAASPRLAEQLVEQESGAMRSLDVDDAFERTPATPGSRPGRHPASCSFDVPPGALLPCAFPPSRVRAVGLDNHLTCRCHSPPSSSHRDRTPARLVPRPPACGRRWLGGPARRRRFRCGRTFRAIGNSRPGRHPRQAAPRRGPAAPQAPGAGGARFRRGLGHVTLTDAARPDTHIGVCPGCARNP